MILAAKALLKENPQPSDQAIREALASNLCRCTGYQKIVEAALAARPSIRLADEIRPAAGDSR